MNHAQVQPLWGAIDDMAKGEKREILFKESGYRCMACGKRWENTGVWSMSQIIPVRHSRQVRLDVGAGSTVPVAKASSPSIRGTFF